MNPVPNYPFGVPPTSTPFKYAPFPPVTPEPYLGPSGTLQPGFNPIPSPPRGR